MDKISELQELVFKNKLQVSEGDYLKMMNALTVIYKTQCNNPLAHEDCEYECPHCSSYISADELEIAN